MVIPNWKPETYECPCGWRGTNEEMEKQEGRNACPKCQTMGQWKRVRA